MAKITETTVVVSKTYNLELSALELAYLSTVLLRVDTQSADGESTLDPVYDAISNIIDEDGLDDEYDFIQSGGRMVIRGPFINKD